jgi:hypothetical protein
MPRDSINNLQQCLIDGGERLFDIAPQAIKNIIEEKQWIGRKDKDGKEFGSFNDFVTHIRWQGLGTSIDDLLLFCRAHPDVQKLLQQEIGPIGEPGAPIGNKNAAKNDHHNIRVVSKKRYGTDPEYIIGRLKKEHRHDLIVKVQDGEIPSWRAAAIEAGWAGYVDPPLEKIRKLLPKLKKEEIHTLINDALKALDNPVVAPVNKKAAKKAAKKLNGGDRKRNGKYDSRRKLSDDDVRYIRSSQETQKSLAEKYAVSIGAIAQVRSGKTYKHVS